MLHRPPASRDRQRDRRRERKRRYRRRTAAGLATCLVEYDDAVLAFLIRWNWLTEAEASDRVKVGEAVTAMMRDASRR